MKCSNVINSISSIVMKKSTPYLKISIISFIFSIIILSLSLILVLNQYDQIKDNFVENENTHVIEIMGKVINNQYENVSYDYVNDIEKELIKKGYSEGYDIYLMYQMSFGIDTSETTEPISLFAIDTTGEKHLFKDITMEDGVLYSNQDLGIERVMLYPPRISINDECISLADGDNIELRTSVNELNHIFNVYDALEIVPYYVTYNTYNQIYKMCFGEYISKESLERVRKTAPIYKVFVYVEDITEVDEIAKVINQNDYSTNFVFQSFDKLGESLGMSLVMLVLFASIVIMFTMVNLLLSWKSYINLISKDIGILKQMGYEKKYIERIYSRNFSKTFWRIAVVSSVVTFIIGIIILEEKQMFFLVLYIIILNVILVLLDKIIVITMLRPKISENVIQLLKLNRAFE